MFRRIRRTSVVLALIASSCARHAPPVAPEREAPSDLARATAKPKGKMKTVHRGFVVAGSDVVDLTDGAVFKHPLVGKRRVVTFVPAVADQDDALLIVDTPSGLAGFDLRKRKVAFELRGTSCSNAWLRGDELLCSSTSGAMLAIAVPSGAVRRSWQSKELERDDPDAVARVGNAWVAQSSSGAFVLRPDGTVVNLQIPRDCDYVTDLAVGTDTLCVLAADMNTDPKHPKSSIACFGLDGAPRWSRKWSDAVRPLRAMGSLLFASTYSFDRHFEAVDIATGGKPPPPFDKLYSLMRVLADAKGTPTAAIQQSDRHSITFRPLTGAEPPYVSLPVETVHPEDVSFAYAPPYVAYSDPSLHASVWMFDTNNDQHALWHTRLPATESGRDDYDAINVTIDGALVVVRGTISVFGQTPYTHVIDGSTGEILRSLPTKLFQAPAPHPWPAPDATITPVKTPDGE